MAESNPPSGSLWFRWGLILLVILAGIVLALILGPDIQPVVQPVGLGQ